MRKQFDKSLGPINYVHIEREKVTQIVVYPRRKTVYVTLEPNLSIARKLEIVDQIKMKTKTL